MSPNTLTYVSKPYICGGEGAQRAGEGAILHSFREDALNGRLLRFLVPLFLLCPAPLFAHVGSPDVYYEGAAGPYQLVVTIRPPVVIPGVAEIEILSRSADVHQIRLTPLRLSGPGAQFAPTPDVAQRSKDSPQFFT